MTFNPENYMLTKIFQGVGTAGLSRFIEESDMKTPQKKTQFWQMENGNGVDRQYKEVVCLARS